MTESEAGPARSTPAPPATTTPALPVSTDWVRAVVTGAQHIPAPAGPGFYASAAGVLRGIGLIQLDPLTRVSTAQRLTTLTRLPRSARAEDIDSSLWPAGAPLHGAPVSFEAFTKVACVFPIEDWPLLQLRRERVRETYALSLDPKMRAQIREVVAAAESGAQIGAIEAAMGATRTTGWNWSEIKHAAELMVRTGELVITARNGIIRLFDLPERALPAPILEAAHLPRDQLRADLARRAAGTLAVMTAADFAHHYHLSTADAARGIALAGLTALQVQGWKDLAYCHPQLLDPVPDRAAPEADATPQPSPHTTSPLGTAPAAQSRLIGPFDPLLRDRGRARRIFDFDYSFEAYVPKDKRLYGHYVMAVLSGTEMVGRVDLQRVGGVLQLNRIFPERGHSTRAVTARARAGAGTLGAQLGTEVELRDAARDR
ncbi:DNA glycosylase AlkZ-like family protein [Nesterenkonia sp. DZ6]|uniref:DNA glycosylase AlkZ-like family protein n=1 Tax=Nesterenkonia sp. DZ6 TaxID=2901229 RepID=UPI001F4D2E7C|nr:crosslink repair DNA glycosylase YcaQ family protein [Nesterenkonia sp. DZ6]MCH8561009.1 winged helix DNA-binding domain-containing protein [Nesterenkonia sp. DZ6]